MDFIPSGDLLTDLQACIDNSTVVHFDYVDRKGIASSRDVAPLEIRDSGIYCWDLAKNGLRLFMLANIGSFTVVDQKFNKDEFK
jgi:predicted DNA-binding transcriptional regulator YafY